MHEGKLNDVNSSEKKEKTKKCFRVPRNRRWWSTHFSVGRITLIKDSRCRALCNGIVAARSHRSARTISDHIRGFMRTVWENTRKAEGPAARLQERLSSFYLELRGRSLAPGKPGVLERASPGRRLGSIPTPSVSLAPSLRCRGKSPRRWRPGRGKRAAEEKEARVVREGERQPSGPSFLPSSFHSLRPFFEALFGLSVFSFSLCSFFQNLAEIVVARLLCARISTSTWVYFYYIGLLYG